MNKQKAKKMLCYITDTVKKWEHHKILLKYNCDALNMRYYGHIVKKNLHTSWVKIEIIYHDFGTLSVLTSKRRKKIVGFATPDMVTAEHFTFSKDKKPRNTIYLNRS
jgi:hypothetical protein